MRTCKKCGVAYDSLDSFVRYGATGYGYTCKQCKKEYDRKYRQENWDRLSTNMKKWEEKNPERVREIRRRSKRKHAGRRNAEWHKRYAMLQGAEGSFTNEEWDALCEKYDYRCLACGEKKKLTKDHIVPIVLGGSNYIDNIQPLCQPCNSRKNKSVTDYRPKAY